MTGKREDSSRKSGVQIPGTPVRSEMKAELRVRELEKDDLSQSDGNAPAFTVRHERLIRWSVLGAVMLMVGLYVGPRIGRGWVPADDGTLAQSALRVFQGQLPHRDFVEVYTGGLSMIHALAFRVLGVNLMSLRICVFLFFLAWLPAVYYIALRFTSPLGAGLTTLVAVSWSFPNYPAAMPSWYNLFFATFGAAALLRFLEVRTRRWLFIAGVCGGLSIIVKVIGAYYVAGVLLFLTFLEQSEVRESPEKKAWGYRLFSICSLFLFLSTLIYLMHSRLSSAEVYHFILPSVVIVGLILFVEWKVSGETSERFRTLLPMVVTFCGGVVSPIAIFLAPYARSGALHDFFLGVTSSAVARANDLAVLRPAPVQQAMFVLPLAGLLAAGMYWDKFQGKVVGAAVGVGAIVIAYRATHSNGILSAVWFSAVMLTPVVVIAGVAAILAKSKHSDPGNIRRPQILLLVALAATCSLVQYPLAAPIYLCYTLPLTILALVAVVTTSKRQPGTYVLAAVAGLYLAFGVVTLFRMQLAELTHEVGRMDKLALPRGGVQIENEHIFEVLIPFLQAHSPNGLMYAGNDCPELYFLSGLKNVTRDDTAPSSMEVLRALRSSDVKLVVINEAPFFPSGQMKPEVRAELERTFPHHVPAWIFQVFWRE